MKIYLSRILSLLIMFQIASCVNGSSNADNISADMAEPIINSTIELKNKEVNVDYYYIIKTFVAGSIKVNISSEVSKGFSIMIIDTNNISIGDPIAINNYQYDFDMRCPAGVYYIKIKNNEYDKWSAGLSYNVDSQFVAVSDYQKYIVGEWKLHKTCDKNYPSNCQNAQYSEITKYFENGTDSVVLSGGAWGGGYGSYEYRLEGDILINTNIKVDSSWKKIDKVTIKIDTLTYIRDDKPNQVFVYLRMSE